MILPNRAALETALASVVGDVAANTYLKDIPVSFAGKRMSPLELESNLREQITDLARSGRFDAKIVAIAEAFKRISS